MPTEPPTDPIPAESTATDGDVHEHTDSAEPGPESEDSTTGPDADRVETLERRVADLEAELDAVRGLLDGVEAVDEAVERRASTALAKAEAVEEQFAAEETGLVRERLPDADGEEPLNGPENSRPTDPRGGRNELDPDPDGRPRRTDSRARSERARGREEHEGSGEPRDGSGRGPRGSAGRDRTRSAGSDASDRGVTGTGAITSVGTGAAASGSGTTATEDAERSLATRLRDAFQ